MRSITTRARRWPLAFSFVAFTTLAACADDPVAPTTPRPVAPNAPVQARGSEFTTAVDISVGSVLVSPVYGATVRVAVSCSGTTTFDVLVSVEQDLKVSGSKQLLQGSSTFEAVTCSEGSSSFSVAVTPYYGTIRFEPGRATVKASVVNQQPGVEAATVTRRVRMYADLL